MDVFPYSLGTWPLDFLETIMELLVLANTSVLFLFLDISLSFERRGDGVIPQGLSHR